MPLGTGGSPKNIIVIIVVSIICSAATMAMYHLYFSERVVLMDIAGFINSQKDGYTTGKISSGKLVENINSLVSGLGAMKKSRVYILKPGGNTGQQGNRADIYTGADDEEE